MDSRRPRHPEWTEEMLTDPPEESKGDHTPYMLFYTSDWTGGTVGFTLEQRGFYVEMLRAMWERKDGFPDDLRRIAAATRCDIRQARRLRSFLINEGKIQLRDNLLINRRMMRDIARHKKGLLAKIGRTSEELQPNLFDIFAKKSNEINAGGGGISYPYPYSEDRSFNPTVIDGGKTLAQRATKLVSPEAMDRARKHAPKWDIHALLSKWQAWCGDSVKNPDEAFVAWVKSYCKGKPPR